MNTDVRKGKPARKAEVWLRQAGVENTLYDPDQGTVHILNDTALAIWNLCDGETDPEEMVQAICDLSGMPAEVVTEDVERTLTELDVAGLLLWGS